MVPGLNTAFLVPRQSSTTVPAQARKGHLGTGTGLNFYFLTPASPSLPYKTTKFTFGGLRLGEKDRTESLRFTL